MLGVSKRESSIRMYNDDKIKDLLCIYCTVCTTEKVLERIKLVNSKQVSVKSEIQFKVKHLSVPQINKFQHAGKDLFNFLTTKDRKSLVYTTIA